MEIKTLLQKAAYLTVLNKCNVAARLIRFLLIWQKIISINFSLLTPILWTITYQFIASSAPTRALMWQSIFSSIYSLKTIKRQKKDGQVMHMKNTITRSIYVIKAMFFGLFCSSVRRSYNRAKWWILFPHFYHCRKAARI